jgi:hypothetical protein
MEDCFCLTEKYDTGFILKQKERKGAMLYKNNFYLKEFRSLFIPNFNWFSRVNIKFIHSDGIYLFEDFL